MLARIRKAQEEKDSGFTLIELLVVMIIIGILAAIAIPAFLSQKNKAKATSAKADVSAIGKEITAHFVDNGPFTAAQTVSTTAATASTPATWALATTSVTGKLSNNNTASGSVTSENVFCVAVWNTDVEGSGTPAAGAAGAGSIFKFQPGVGITKGNCP